MTYTLAIGARAYSSWSLRGWLALAAFGLRVETVMARLDTPHFEADLAPFAPARTVPALRIEGVGTLWDTIAIAETLAERHPEAGHWPEAPGERLLARALVGEMHSGFAALREACPMNLRHTYRGFEPPPEVRADLERIETLWAAARLLSGRGPWLFGRYTLADAFFAPVATRIVTYGLAVSPAAAEYVAAHVAEPNFRNWRAEGLAEPWELEGVPRGLDVEDWPA
jgi:glutathione S-transferase